MSFSDDGKELLGFLKPMFFLLLFMFLFFFGVFKLLWWLEEPVELIELDSYSCEELRASALISADLPRGLDRLERELFYDAGGLFKHYVLRCLDEETNK